MKVRWIRSPSYLHLVPTCFGFGISFVHIRNLFIATDVLVRKKPFQCEQPCVLAARGGTWTLDDVVCYLGTEHSSDRLLIVEAVVGHLLGPQNLTRIVQDPICEEIFVLCRTG
jgi:hypothetical protein